MHFQRESKLYLVLSDFSQTPRYSLKKLAQLVQVVTISILAISSLKHLLLVQCNSTVTFNTTGSFFFSFHRCKFDLWVFKVLLKIAEIVACPLNREVCLIKVVFAVNLGTKYWDFDYRPLNKGCLLDAGLIVFHSFP